MSKQTIGFDIGENQVKVTLCDRSGIKKAFSARVPDHLVQNSVISSMDAMADFLRELTRENGINRGNAAVVLPTEAVFTRGLTMPVMTHQQLQYNLPFEFKDYLTEDKSKYFFDYAMREILRDEEGKATEMRLFACAVAKTVIADYRAMFRRAGFRLTIAVPEEYAGAAVLCRHLRAHDISQGVYRCIVDLGYRSTKVFIYRHDEHVITRSIDMGVADLDKLIAEQTGADIHIAETYRLTNYNDVLHLQEASELYGRMAVEVMKAVNFFNYNNRDAALEELYLCGGGVAIEPLQQAVCDAVPLQLHTAAELLEAETLDEPWLYLKAYGATIQD